MVCLLNLVRVDVLRTLRVHQHSGTPLWGVVSLVERHVDLGFGSQVAEQTILLGVTRPHLLNNTSSRVLYRQYS